MLQEAARGTSVWATSQTVDDVELARHVRAALRPADPESVRILSMPGEILHEIVGTQAPNHVAGWIGAGHVHEELLKLSPAPDFVFCLDPWAAMLLGRSRALHPKAKWVYVRDPAKLGKDREYWEETDAWLGQLGFDEILPVEALATAPPAPATRKRPGAWEWRTFGSAASATAIAVRYSGSILRLRVFTESFLRQGEVPSLLIVAPEPSAELWGFISLLRLSRPELKVEVVPAAPTDAPLLDDGLILPMDFQRRARGRRLILNPEVAAHILLGDLDPLPVYEDLLRAHGGAPEDLLVLA